MDLAEIMATEREALLGEYALGEVPPYAAVDALDEVIRTPSRLRIPHPCWFAACTGVPPDRAQVQSCPSLGYRFLWCHADNDSYRADYLAFANAEYGAGLDALPQTLHVDHLFNRERARAVGLNWIRMVLLPRGVNTSHGAGYEKSRTNGLIGTAGRPRGVDEVNLLKLCGLRTPRKGMPLPAEVYAHASRMADIFGLSVDDIIRNVEDLMEVAAFEPAED